MVATRKGWNDHCQITFKPDAEDLSVTQLIEAYKTLDSAKATSLKQMKISNSKGKNN